MILPSNIISDFVKATKDKPEQPRESVLYGTIQSDTGYVQLDGSTVLTPIENKAVIAKAGDRVTVTIKDHKAIVTGNIASPAAREKDTLKISDLDAVNTEIANLKADNTIIRESITSVEEDIKNLKDSDTIIKNTLESHTTRIETLIADNTTINETLVAMSKQIQNLTNRVEILEESALNNPIIASTEAEMAALLIAKNEGKTVKYIGPTGIYKQNALYTIVDEP